MVYKAKITSKPTKVKIGPNIIEILTSGMYNNPLMVIREYVQNSVDAIDLAVEHGILTIGSGVVEIQLDGKNRCFTIKDNGVGVPNGDIEQVLCSLGCSTKNPDCYRGFRGIGRLGGIGYCESVQFETRGHHNEPVALVKWEGKKLAHFLEAGHKTAETAVRESVHISFRSAEKKDGDHFFQVSLKGIHHFHRDELMNMNAIISYLGQVAPVPFDKSRFSFAKEIEDYLQPVDGFKCYRIFVNGRQVYRPHTDNIELAANRADRIQGIEFLEINGNDHRSLGHGWFANTSYLASLPPRIGMRGLRVRQGNIEVGDEYFLANIYSERRFSTWHIGEIHLGYSLTANARRDGFEQSAQHESFLEQMNVLGVHLSFLCRKSSKNRSGVVTAEIALNQLEKLAQCRLYVNEQHLNRSRLEVQRICGRLHEYEGKGWLCKDSLKRLHKLRNKLESMDNQAIYLADALDGRVLRHRSKRILLESVAEAIMDDQQGNGAIDDLLIKILGQYLKPI